jgi:hypothetical protein
MRTAFAIDAFCTNDSYADKVWIHYTHPMAAKYYSTNAKPIVGFGDKNPKGNGQHSGCQFHMTHVCLFM